MASPGAAAAVGGGAASGAAPSSTPAAPALDAILLLEQPLAHLPYDQLTTLLRTQQRLLSRELGQVQASLVELAAAASAPSAPGSARIAPDVAAEHLDQNIKRIKALKRRLAQLNAGTKTALNSASARYAHLQSLHTIASTADPAFQQWSATRLQRVLVDYMLRNAATQAAAQLTSAAGIGPLVDTALFAELDRLEASLYPPTSPPSSTDPEQPCLRALAWCAENKPALDAVGSRLEFDLRMQVYIELARTRTPDNLRAAIAYLRTHLLPLLDAEDDHLADGRRDGEDEALANGTDPLHSLPASQGYTSPVSRKKQVSRALGLLACSPSSLAYADLYHQDRWASLRAQLRACALRIHSLPAQPMLHIALSAGLSSLKLPACFQDNDEEDGGEEVGGQRETLRRGEEALLDSEGAVAALEGETARAVQRAVELAGRAAVEVSIPQPVGPPSLELATTPASASASAGLARGTGTAASSTAIEHHTSHRPTSTSTSTSTLTRLRTGTKAPTAPHHPPHLRDGNPDCPTCERAGLGILAREVPWSHHENSTIVCRLGGHVMSEDDPPMCLPNGRVYSRSALEELALKSADGQTITDPRTGDVYPFSALRKMYIS